MRARSTAASVWPARRRTPPSLAMSGKRWPGRTKSAGWLAGSQIAWIVRARSAAVIPVRQLRWSTGTVKFVPSGAVLSSTIGPRPSRLQVSGRIGMQSCPRPWVIMKLTISGVTFSAAQIKSPSFSRSSASTTMTSSPRAMAAMAASMVEKLLAMDTVLGPP